MKTLRLAHIESSKNWGGQELRIIEQSEWLIQQGAEVWIIAPPQADILAAAKKRGIRHFALSMRSSVSPVTLFRLALFLKRHRIDVLDCHSDKDAYYAAYIKWLGICKVVRSKHNTNPIKDKVKPALVWKYGQDKIVVTAEIIKKNLLVKKLTTDDQVLVVSAGVDCKRFRPDIDTLPLRKSLGIKTGQTVIANIGMIRPDKGQWYFVQAATTLLEKYPDLVFLHIGDPGSFEARDYYRQLQQHIAQSPHRERFLFLGYHSDIENYISLTDIVVIASIATEARTRLVPQAFLCHTNVIATTTGGLPEMISHGETGLLCEPKRADALAEAVEKLLNEPVMAKNLREAAYRHAMQYNTLEIMMHEINTLYHSLLKP